MLPSLEAVIGTHIFLARRFKLSTPRDLRIAKARREGSRSP